LVTRTSHRIAAIKAETPKERPSQLEQLESILALIQRKYGTQPVEAQLIRQGARSIQIMSSDPQNSNFQFRIIYTDHDLMDQGAKEAREALLALDPTGL
jgi:hypothetical protein